MENIAEGKGRTPDSKTSPVTISPASEVNHLPRYIRLPKPMERCPWTGMSRGTLNDLILGPDAPVESLVIRREGASRGVRLIKFQSLLHHLEVLQSQQANEKGKELA